MTTEHTTATSTAIARAFTEAWTRGDRDTAASYVAEEVVFDGPLGHRSGREAYLDGLRTLAQSVGLTGVEILAAFGDDTQALIMYDLLSDQFGALTCAKLLTFRDGRIARDQLTFDSYPVRKARGG